MFYMNQVMIIFYIQDADGALITASVFKAAVMRAPGTSKVQVETIDNGK